MFSVDKKCFFPFYIFLTSGKYSILYTKKRSYTYIYCTYLLKIMKIINISKQMKDSNKIYTHRWKNRIINNENKSHTSLILYEDELSIHCKSKKFCIIN